MAACEDPNPKVAGAGLQRLRDAGIAVETGLLRVAARELNRGFFCRIERQRPCRCVVEAGDEPGWPHRRWPRRRASKWITGEAARADVQRWRARSSAILTGIGTVLADDPRLTVRALEPLSHRERGGGEGPVASKRNELPEPSPDPAGHPHPVGEGQRHVPPLRVVLDRELRAPRDARVLDGSAPTLIVHGDGSRARDDRFASVELAVAPLRDVRLDLAAVLALLGARGVNELQVEAGPTLCGTLFAMGLVDELLLYVAPVLLGDQARPLLMLPGIDTIAAGRRLCIVEDQRRIGEDQRLLLR